MSREHFDSLWTKEVATLGESEGFETNAAMEENDVPSTDPIERSTSAPPALQESFFAAQTLLEPAEFIRLFEDIRNDEKYELFYEQYKNPLLPPPLERSPLLWSEASSPAPDSQRVNGVGATKTNQNAKEQKQLTVLGGTIKPSVISEFRPTSNHISSDPRSELPQRPSSPTALQHSQSAGIVAPQPQLPSSSTKNVIQIVESNESPLYYQATPYAKSTPVHTTVAYTPIAPHVSAAAAAVSIPTPTATNATITTTTTTTSTTASTISPAATSTFATNKMTPIGTSPLPLVTTTSVMAASNNTSTTTSQGPPLVPMPTPIVSPIGIPQHQLATLLPQSLSSPSVAGVVVPSSLPAVMSQPPPLFQKKVQSMNSQPLQNLSELSAVQLAPAATRGVTSSTSPPHSLVTPSFRPQPHSDSVNSIQHSQPIDIQKAPKKGESLEVWPPIENLDLNDKIRKTNLALGKVTINSDANLSSSTEDLLSLAGKTHQLTMSSSVKDDEPSDDLASYSQTTPTASAPPLPAANSKPQRIKVQTVTKIQSPPPSPLPLPATAAVVPTAPPPVPPVVPVLNLAPLQRVNTTPQICRYYAQGYCTRGERCNFLHINATTIDESTRAALGLKQQLRSTAPPIPPAPTKTPYHRGMISPSRYANLTIEECIGNVYTMCKDQHGCRFLQKKIDEDGEVAVNIVFNETLDHIVELMSDPFGNYLCQKLLEKCSEPQRLAIVKGVSRHLVNISKNMHGTRAVQKLIELLSTPEEIKIVRDSLKGSVVELIQDLNGNHVIQKALQRMEPNDNQFIYDAVAQHCTQVATHRHGCCVMQRCIDHGTEQQKLQLVEGVNKHAFTLVQDAFGNYVVQYILDLGIANICGTLVKQLTGHLYYLATQKFSSNVIEKCLKTGNTETVQTILNELINATTLPESIKSNTSPSESSAPHQIDPLIALLQDPYGNYVVQTALAEAAAKAPREYQTLCARIRPHLPALRNTAYLKRLTALLNLHPHSHPSHHHSNYSHYHGGGPHQYHQQHQHHSQTSHRNPQNRYTV